MVRKIDDPREMARLVAASNCSPERFDLYRRIAAFSRGRLVLAINDGGYFCLYKELDGRAANPSIFVEHHYLYRVGERGSCREPIAPGPVADLLDFLAAAYEALWLSFDNLPPNGHRLDDPEHRYNLLPVAGLSYDGYLAGLRSGGRLNLRKALGRSAGATLSRLRAPAEIAAQLEGPLAAHCRARYGGDSLLERDLGRQEARLITALCPCDLLLAGEGERYSFLLAFRLEGALTVMLVGGSDASMIKRSYHELIRGALAEQPAIRVVDAGSEYPALKRQMGFRQARFYALVEGEPDWTKLLF